MTALYVALTLWGGFLTWACGSAWQDAKAKGQTISFGESAVVLGMLAASTLALSIGICGLIGLLLA